MRYITHPRWGIAVVAALIGVLLMQALAAGPAGAAPVGRDPGAASPQVKKAVQTFTFRPEAGAANAASANPVGTITCQVLASPVRRSSTTVEGVGVVDCRDEANAIPSMQFIDLRILLFRRSANPGLVGEYYEYAPGGGRIVGAAGGTCVTDEYFTYADSYIVPPPGYTPDYLLLRDESPFVRITC
ncbi:hypothetical protein [Streptomyces synnematoformans]|uniref:Uncharacterized protein n=1 Tax=Streptomyces synnematoformans TaxID=415721 RepID=A0ABN2XS61_9ACTN